MNTSISHSARLCALATVCLSSAWLAACSDGSGTSGASGNGTAGSGSTITASRMLLTSADGGSNLLGAITELPLAATDAQAVFATFDGTPSINNLDSLSGHGLIFNTADNKFYAVLEGSGVDKLGVLVSFDPATDTLTALKSFVRRSYPDVTGVNGETLPFEQPNGFFRLPLLSPDGKSLLLRASYGGVDNRGALLQVNIEPGSANFLQDSLVYSFFDFEKSQGNYCNSLRALDDAHTTEMAWGKDGSGNAVVYMGVNGLSYDVDRSSNPTQPLNCAPYTLSGTHLDRISGRMFALRPRDAADLSKPWIYSSGYTPFNPDLSLGRQIYWDTKKQAIRWTTETIGGGELDFRSGHVR